MAFPEIVITTAVYNGQQLRRTIIVSIIMERATGSQQTGIVSKKIVQREVIHHKLFLNIMKGCNHKWVISNFAPPPLPFIFFFFKIICLRWSFTLFTATSMQVSWMSWTINLVWLLTCYFTNPPPSNSLCILTIDCSLAFLRNLILPGLSKLLAEIEIIQRCVCDSEMSLTIVWKRF